MVVELCPDDALGIGFVMACLEGTADPETVLASPPALAAEIAAAMAKIHALDAAQADHLPVLDAATGIARLCDQFAAAGGDRPIIALPIITRSDQ